MSKYAGKICPYCKTGFDGSEEVVVCSLCGMPHHKSCWIENSGCTTFGCTGTMTADTQDSSFDIEIYPEDSSDTVMFCPQCGTRRNNNDGFCYNCGYSFNSREPQYNQSNYSGAYNNDFYNNNTSSEERLIEMFVVENASYYKRVFSELSDDKRVSWNWPAFLVSSWWMIYRKMYGWGIAFLGACLLITLLIPNAWYLTLIIDVLGGMFGNYIYKKDIEKRIEKYNYLSGGRDEFVSKNSGTNMLAVIITIVVYIVVLVIIKAS